MSSAYSNNKITNLAIPILSERNVYAKFDHIKGFPRKPNIRNLMIVNEVLLIPFLVTCRYHIVDMQILGGHEVFGQPPCFSWPRGTHEGPNGFLHSRYLSLWHTELRYEVGYNTVITRLTET